MMHWIAAILVGVTALLLAAGLRGWFFARLARDAEHVRKIAFRFSPTDINPMNIVWGCYAGLAGILLLLLWLTPNPLFAIVFWSGLLFVPSQIVELAWRRRRKKIDEQLPPAIASLSNCVKAGLTLVQAIQRLGTQAPEPVRTEFRVMANRYSHGADLERTITEAKGRLNLEAFNLFASTLLVNREMGGDVAQTLDRIANSLEKLKLMRRTVEAHTAEGRTNIKLLLAAPVFMLLLLSTIDSEGVAMLFQTIQGWLVLTIAGLLAGCGVFWASKIVHSEI
jgi:tight adherence protein B